MQIVIFPILLFQVILALHIPHHLDQKPSSDIQYLLALAEKQDQYKSDLQTIQTQIDDINNIISSNTTVGYRLYKLEQAIAQQRDTVYSMENNMTIPFNLKNCTCLQLSGSKVGELTSKVALLQNDLDNLEKEVENCPDCKDLDQTRSQISQQKKYLDIINQTLHSDCKYVPKNISKQTPTGMVNINDSYFKDNLNAKNWYYGNIDEKKYRFDIFVRSTQYNLTSCPLQTPYAHYENNTCFNCKISGAFNLGQRSCIDCPQGMFFNVSSASCETCQQNQIFNGTTAKCQICAKGFKNDGNNTCVQNKNNNPSNGTTPSNINNNSNTTNGTNTNKCPLKTPHWNYVTNKCQQCPIGTVYEASTQYCRPTNYIGICPTQKPFYNITTNLCQACPNSTTYNSATYRCQYSGGAGAGAQTEGLQCKVDQTYNETTKQCIKTSLLCTEDQNYSEKFKRCMNKSQLCQWDQYYNSTSKVCNQIPFITSPYVFNLIYSVNFDKYINLYTQSKQDNPLLQDCPLSKPFFSYLDLKCISCNNEKPYFNLDQGYCQDCAYPTVYNPSGHKCQSIIGGHHRMAFKHKKSNQHYQNLFKNLMNKL